MVPPSGRVGLPRSPKRVVLPDVVKAALVVIVVVAACAVPMIIFLPSEQAAPVGSPESKVTSTAAAVVDGPTTSSESTSTTEQAPVKVTIAAVGDVMGAQTVRWAAWDATTEKYDFYSMFKPVAPYLEGADYTVANLETRLADPGPDGEYVGFRILNSPQALGEGLKQAGVDLCALANNHSLDMGFDGIVQTLDRLDTIGLAHVGCYRSAAEKRASQPFIVDIKGIKVAFINYTDVNNGLYLAAQHKTTRSTFWESRPRLPRPRPPAKRAPTWWSWSSTGARSAKPVRTVGRSRSPRARATTRACWSAGST
jgi:hypothetical protein